LTVRAAQIHPQVFVLEDLHWMDKATEEYLAFVADSIAASRALLILSYRTGYTQPFGERTYHTRIALDTLSNKNSVQMAQAMLGADQLPAELEILVARKAEGNPFFVEEVVKSLQEVGALRTAGDRYILTKRLDDIFVPDTIQDVIMARIDRLAEAPKKTLQVASVIGREFTRRLLDRLAEIRGRTEEPLRELKAIELIYEKSVLPELAYMFKHALTHEVAYNSLLVQRRKELHRLIAFAIQELYADRLPEHYEVLAYHFSKTEEAAKAVEYLLKAAEKAVRAFANREALALYEQALDAADQGATRLDLHTLMGIHRAMANLYIGLGQYEPSLTEGERVVDLARQAGDPSAEAAALSWMGWASGRAHAFDRAVAYARQAIGMAEKVDAKPALAGGHFVLGWIHAVTGHLAEGSEETQRALAISREAREVTYGSLSLVVAGFVKNWQGEYAEACRLLSEGLGIARQNNLLLPLLLGGFAHGLALTGQGDYDGALTTLEEGLALSEKVGDEAVRPRFINTLGWLHREVGALDRALELSRLGAERARKRADHEMIGNAEIDLGETFLAKGDLGLAREFLKGAHRLVRDPATSDYLRWRYSTRLFASLGELSLLRGDPAKAREFADRCLEIATRTNSRKNLVKGWRLRGEIAAAGRQWGESEGALRHALTVARAIGNPTQLWKTHLALGQFHAERKEREAARQAYVAAREVIDRMKANLQHPGLRSSLETAPVIRRVYDLAAS
jgi:tetratricopeptide (TPR) repeat protein